MTKTSSRPPFSPGKRQRVGEALERFGILPLLGPLHDRVRRSLTVLAYHRVAQLNGAEPCPLDLDLVSATPEDFEWQMRFLRETMQPVSLQQVIDHVENRWPLPPRAVAVTFDDGFNDTYQHAFPVLKRYAIRATVFVTTGYIDTGEPFWFEIAALLMMRAPARTIELPGIDGPLPAGASAKERRAGLRLLQRSLQDLPEARRKTVIAEWLARAQLLGAPTAEMATPLTWAQVREMAAAGVDFGSHCVTHPNLAKLDDAALSWELANSKLTLERQLAREIGTLAYPIGTRSSYDQRVIKRARELGYRLALSFVPGGNWQHSLAPFELRRQSVGLATSHGYFKALVTLPSWAR